MNETLLTYVAAAILGLVAGIVGSLIAPWVQWGVEKRRERQAKRRELIRASRSILSTEIDRKTFRETEIYSQLKPHLNRDVIDDIGRDKPGKTPEEAGVGTDDFKQGLLEDIARIEREWILI